MTEQHTEDGDAEPGALDVWAIRGDARQAELREQLRELKGLVPPAEDGVCCILEEPPAGEVPPGGWHDADAVDGVYTHTGGTLRHIGSGTVRLVDGKPVLRWRGSTGWHIAVVCSAEDMGFSVVMQGVLGSPEPLVLMTLAENLYHWVTDAEHADHATRCAAVRERSAKLLERREGMRAQEAHKRAAEVPSEISRMQPYQVPGAVAHGRRAMQTSVHPMKRLMAAGATFSGGERQRDGAMMSDKRNPCRVRLVMRHSSGRLGELVVGDAEKVREVYARELPHRFMGDDAPKDGKGDTRKDGEDDARVRAELARWEADLAQQVLPGCEAQGDMRELYALAAQAVTDLVGARRVTWLYAAVAAIRRDVVRLTDDGGVPADLRKEVMRMTGCPPERANGRQLREYRAFLRLLLLVDLEIVPLRKRKRKRTGKDAPREEEPHLLPLLVVTSTTVKDGTAYTVSVNPELSRSVLRIPQELLRLTDADDPDGVARALGVAMLTKVQMSMAHPQALARPESMRKLMERAGLLSWAQECERDTHKRGRNYVKRRVAEALELLQSLPSLRAWHLNAIGGTHVTWGHGKRYMELGKVHWRTPEWLEQNALPAQRATPALEAAAHQHTR